MTALVTGAAGFIGSHLVDRLLADGERVRGVDCFTPYYPRDRKMAHLRGSWDHPRFDFVEADLRDCPLAPMLDGVDTVYHLAAQPGVRLSWADGFDIYDQLNIKVTQRLLEALRGGAPRRFVMASSSSVYGTAERFPTTEDLRCLPFSPYGVTKLAAEALAIAYAHNFGIPALVLRYFTVYGPRQRPDMAIARLIAAAGDGTAFPLFGSGDQQREFTHVFDVVEATVRAGHHDVEVASVFNVAGGSATSLRRVIGEVEAIVGHPIAIECNGEQPGDVRVTSADISRARERLGWEPLMDLAEGLRSQVEWHQQNDR